MTTNEISGAVSRTVEKAASNLHGAINPASDAARPAVDHLASGAHHAMDSLAKTTSQVAHTLDARGRQLMDAQSRLTASCSSMVREKPIKALGIALAVGFVVSWLLRQRSTQP